MSEKGGDKLNEISIFAFNINSLEKRIESGFDLKYIIEKGEENEENVEEEEDEEEEMEEDEEEEMEVDEEDEESEDDEDEEDEEIEEDLKNELTQETQEEKYFDIFLLFETFLTDEKKDKKTTQWLTETKKRYRLHRIPAKPVGTKSSEGYLFGCKRNTTKNFECKFIELANHCVIKISSKKDKNTMPTFIIPVYINFKPLWKEKFEKLKETVSCLKDQNVLLIGDFNAWIGNEQIINKEQKRNKYLKEHRNARHINKNAKGKQLIKWCKEIGVTVLNGRTKSDEDGKLTRYHDKKKSTLDFCFVQGNLHQCVTDFEVMEERWGSDHHPMVVKARLSFPKSTHILFTDLLAASTRPFESTGTAEKITESEKDKEKADKSKELLEKIMDQVVYKKYIENLSKMFAKIKDKQVLHELVEENENFFGQNIKYETTVFVQNMEKTLWNVISKGLAHFPEPLEEDEMFYRDISCNGDIKIKSIAQSFLKEKQMLFAFIIHLDKPVFNSLDGKVLLFKMSAFGIFMKPFIELLNLTAEESVDGSSESSQSKKCRLCLRRRCLRTLIASLKDYLPGGINWQKENTKIIFNNDKCVILAETATMIERMVEELMQYCDLWDIRADFENSKMVVYKTTVKPAHQKFICRGQKIPRVIYSNFYESNVLN